MPELPEVETTTRALQQKVLKRAFVDVWCDNPKMVKNPSFEEFKKEIKGKEVEKVWRRGKNIIFNLSGGYSMLVHQNLTGHFLYGLWRKENGKWIPAEKGPMNDPMNSYIHLIFYLDNGKMLALSDLRKFAKVELQKTEDLLKDKGFKSLGPEPLKEDFSFKKFKGALKGKRGRIKQVLMKQEVIAGVGNIYSDEALFRAKIHPFREVSELKEKELKNLYSAVLDVLKKGLKVGGESISDYRNVDGEKGRFDQFRQVYRREGEKCPQCGTKIKREKIGGRSCHFCPKCQK